MRFFLFYFLTLLIPIATAWACISKPSIDEDDYIDENDYKDEDDYIDEDDSIDENDCIDEEDCIDNDGQLTMPELVRKYRYPIETHEVTTQDGYILTVYRIPFGRKCRKNHGKKTPVLLQHGMLMSSFDWVIMGPKKSLGYILADACYDVWMGNNRGNSQSRKHMIFSDKDKRFWDFSWHEMGVYDLPAMIDHILNLTRKPGLHYIGYSGGTTQFFVFNSFYPEYKDRVITAHALSPVVFMEHLWSPLVRFALYYGKPIVGFTYLAGKYEITEESNLINYLGSQICKKKYLDLEDLCSNLFFLVSGFNEDQFDPKMLTAIMGHTPAGGSTKTVFHYGQQIKSGKFRQFDYGKIGNLIIYNSKYPPDYNLSRVTIPTVLYYSNDDWLASVIDVEALIQVLPNILEIYKVPDPKWSHSDFVYGTDVVKSVYSKLLQVLDRFC